MTWADDVIRQRRRQNGPPPLEAKADLTAEGQFVRLVARADFARQLLEELRHAPRTPAIEQLGRALVAELKALKGMAPVAYNLVPELKRTAGPDGDYPGSVF
jgi:hypothetical protein